MDARQFKSQMLPLSREMFATAVSLTHNVRTAEDLVQDAYERLWIHRNELDRVDSLGKYANATVRHLYLDNKRKGKGLHIDLHQEMLFADSSADTERQTEASEDTRTVFRLIELLPQQQQRIITLRDIEGREYDEIEKLTGLSQIAIRVNLSRARKTVRLQFKEYYRNERKQ